MGPKKLHDFITNSKSDKFNSEQEFEAFEIIFNHCIEKGYKLENFIENIEDCSICEQQKFIHLVALQDDEILDMVYEFHKNYGSSIDFCKEELKNKFELQLLENTFEVAI